MSESKLDHLTVDNSDETKKWYVVQVLTNAEKHIAAAIASRAEQFNLKDSFGQILVPTETVTEVRRGEKVTVERPILPGYILIMIDPADKRAFELVRRTPRVRKFVSSENTGDPDTLSLEDLKPIIDYSEGTVKSPGSAMSFEVGDSVSIIEGAFDGWAGNIEEVDRKNGRLKVLVPIFGRLAPVDLSYDQVKKDVD